MRASLVSRLANVSSSSSSLCRMRAISATVRSKYESFAYISRKYSTASGHVVNPPRLSSPSQEFMRNDSKASSTWKFGHISSAAPSEMQVLFS